MERIPNKSQHTKVTLEKKILPPLLPGFELATFRSRAWHSYKQALPTPDLKAGTSDSSGCSTERGPLHLSHSAPPRAHPAETVLKVSSWI